MQNTATNKINGLHDQRQHNIAIRFRATSATAERAGLDSSSSNSNVSTATVGGDKEKEEEEEEEKGEDEPWAIPGGGVSAGFWRDECNRRKFFDWAAKKLNISKPEDWYRISRDDLYRLGGMGLMTSYYEGSLSRALAAVYPDVEWLPWKFASVPNGFWKDVANQRRFFDWIARELGISPDKREEDWYKVTRESLRRLGAMGLLTSYYGGSLVRALSALYPDYEWLPWKFAGAVSSGFWKDAANRKRFFDWAARELGIERAEQWFAVAPEQIASLPGGSVLLSRHYEGSLPKALSSIYPEHEWPLWRFARVPLPSGFWRDVRNQRAFFDWAGRQLGVSRLEDWYEVSREDVARLGGGMGMLKNHHDGSLARALAAVYPEFDWMPWRFKRFTVGGGSSALSFDASNESEVRRYMEYLAKELEVHQLDEWYRVSTEHVRELGGYSILEQNGGLQAVLRRLYPEHDWDEKRFHTARGKRSNQRWLRVMAKKIFPNEEMIEEYQHSAIRFGDSNEIITLDLWIPSLSLAFEYHGQQHYHDMHVFGGNLSKQQQRDREKQEACARVGVTLIVIPYWWDRKPESLAATITTKRPELASKLAPEMAAAVVAANASPIPEELPADC